MSNFLEGLFEVAKDPDLVRTITEAQPIVKNVIDAVFASGENIEDALIRLAKGSANIKAAYLKQLEADGFSREEAMILTCNTWQGLLDGIRKGSASAKNR